MPKYLIVLVFISFTNCSSSRHHLKEDIIELRKDLQGRVVLKKFKQWKSYPGGSGLVLASEEYDTLGRVVKEYGFNHPLYGKQYLIETVYKNSSKYLINKFKWNSVDSNAFYKDYTEAFDSEMVFVEYQKAITVFKQGGNNENFIGSYNSPFPSSQPNLEKESFTFQIKWADMKFDADRKLIMTSITKL